MADQRQQQQPLRFRVSSAPPRASAETPPVVAESITRPPFRPPSIAQVPLRPAMHPEVPFIVVPQSAQSANKVSSLATDVKSDPVESVQEEALRKGIKGVSKLVHSITSGKTNTELMIGESVDVIMLVGENTGAVMQMTSESSKKREHVHIRRNYRSDPEESVESETDAEQVDGGSSRGKDEELENCTFLNSNVQGVNNSVALKSSVSEGSPGINFGFAPYAEPLPESRNGMGASDAFRDQFNIANAEKHTYKPTIRRRCLRGLMMESSDSDESKPRRHGCRYGCGQKNNQEKRVDLA